jgi:GNAT superfamily N-acetyltransferase
MVDQRQEGDRIELHAMVDLFEACDSSTQQQLDLGVRRIDGAVALSASQVDSVLFNRVVSVGMSEPGTETQLDAIQSHYADRNIRRYLVHLHPDAQPAMLRQWLTDKGFVPFRRPWVKFVREPLPIAEATTELTTRPVRPEEATAFAEIASRGFDLPLPVVQMLRALPTRPGWHVYGCFDGAQPAAVAAMYVRDEAAWFGFAVTEPQFRRRGAQNALLVRRIQDAAALGCQRLYVETGDKVPGEPQNSYRNIERVGFRRIYARDNFVLNSGS